MWELIMREKREEDIKNNCEVPDWYKMMPKDRCKKNMQGTIV